jgi:predicted DNA-binding protein YlxM (UPF0122 family)
MTFNQKQLDDIAEYAALFFSPAEIADMINVDNDEFQETIKDKNSIASKTYYKHKYIQQAEIRKQIIKLAKHGSPQAEDMVNKYIAAQNSHEIDM